MARPLFLLKLLIRTGLARYLPGVNRLTDGGADFLRYYADPLLAAPRSHLRRAGRLLEAPPHDVIDLSTIDAKSTIHGNQAFKFIGTAAFHLKAGELHDFKQNLVGTAHDKTIVEGDVNGDGHADFQIELSGLKALTAGDFLL